MADEPNIPLINHELADDELAWVAGVYNDFDAARAGFVGAKDGFDPKEALRDVLRRNKDLSAAPMDLSGNGPWRLGMNSHGRFVACVFLNKVELHKHAKSRTDQFPMYVIGEADAFSEGEDSQPILKAVTGGDHFHNSPGAPHAFLPKVGVQARKDWEIAFIAITPRNLREETRAAYRRVVGVEAPVGV